MKWSDPTWMDVKSVRTRESCGIGEKQIVDQKRQEKKREEFLTFFGNIDFGIGLQFSVYFHP
jgi:hypothetical protein